MALPSYIHFENFVLRTPVFPFSLINSILTDNPEPLSLLRKLWNNKLFKEAIFLSSIELYNEIQKLMSAEIKDKDKCQKIYLSALKYFIRMVSRPAPFGLMAGLCMGKIGDKTDIVLSPVNDAKRSTRLDMNYLCALAFEITNNSKFNDNILFCINTSLYEVGDYYRYVEYLFEEGFVSHKIVSIEKNEFLRKILNQSTYGESKKNLIELLCDTGIDRSEARIYIDELIRSQILVSNINPSVTSQSLFEDIINLTNLNNEVSELTDTLIEVKSMLPQLDEKICMNNPNIYNSIIERLSNTGVEFNDKFIFQTDLIINKISCEINKSVSERLLKGLDVLTIINNMSELDNLNEFKRVFVNRYSDEEIPLLEVLDIESGIGYPNHSNSLSADISPLIDDLSFNKNVNDKNNVPVSKSGFLYRKYTEWLDNKLDYIEIYDEDIEGEKADSCCLSDTFYSIVSILDNGNNSESSIYLEYAGGSSAANLISRFSYADPSVLEFNKDVIFKENLLAEDYIIAELVHLPEYRTGNILLRPAIREYEIPYLARSSVINDHQISPADLTVSVRENRIILKSSRLKKVVIPKQTTAHNYSQSSLPVYNFLCDLQFQGISPGISFSWYPIDNDYNYYPRLVYKNIILSRAYWIINTIDLKELSGIPDDSIRLNELIAWLKENNIPTRLNFAEGEKELFLNLENIHFSRIFFDIIKGKTKIILKESFTEQSSNCINSGKEKFVGQFIIPFYRNDVR